MKRIKAACLLQTVCFQSKDDKPSAYQRQQVAQEYEAYKKQMERRGTKFQILEEQVQENGSIILMIKKQNNLQPVGDYMD